jgi:Mechanosensitive ion channel, conserved TM helix
MEVAFDDMSKAVAAYLPNLLGALAILIVGWLVARIIAAVVTGTLRRTELDNRLARVIAGDRSAGVIHLEQWVGRVVFYLLMILVLVAFFQTLGLTLVTEPLNRLLNQFFQFAPQLFGAAAILVIAWVLANLLRAIISRVLRAANIDQRLAEQAESSARVSLAQTIADTAYWLVFLLFLPALLNALSLQGLLGPVQGMLNKVLDFLPNIFTAGLILLVSGANRARDRDQFLGGCRR